MTADGNCPSLHWTSPYWCASLSSVGETEALGRHIGRRLTGGEVLALLGPLGAGKTALTRGLATGLDIDPQQVTSPTFTLIHEYHGRLRLIHADLYRLDHPNEIAQLGIEDYLRPSTALVIEWADRGGTVMFADRLDIHLEHVSPDARAMSLRATGAQADQLLKKIVQDCAQPQSDPPA